MNINYLMCTACIAFLLFSSTLSSTEELRGQNSAVEICKDRDLIFDTALSHSKELGLTKNVKTEILRMQFEYKKRMIELESRVDITELSRRQAIIDNFSPDLKNSQIELKKLNETVIALKKDMLTLQLDAEKNLLNILTPDQLNHFDSIHIQAEKSCNVTSLETTPPPPTTLEAFGMPHLEAMTTEIAALAGEKLLKWIGVPFSIIVAVLSVLG